MSDHQHAFTLVSVLHGRFRCACGVYGTRRGSRIVALVCQEELLGRKHCGADAVQVDGNRQHNRCAEHERKWAA